MKLIINTIAILGYLFLFFIKSNRIKDDNRKNSNGLDIKTTTNLLLRNITNIDKVGAHFKMQLGSKKKDILSSERYNKTVLNKASQKILTTLNWGYRQWVDDKDERFSHLNLKFNNTFLKEEQNENAKHEKTMQNLLGK